MQVTRRLPNVSTHQTRVKTVLLLGSKNLAPSRIRRFSRREDARTASWTGGSKSLFLQVLKVDRGDGFVEFEGYIL